MKRLVFIIIGLIIFAGLGYLLVSKKTGAVPDPIQTKSMIKISSSVFPEGGGIPKKYSCDDQGINPPLSVSDVPSGTKSLVLIVEDPDAPAGTYTHWTMWNIDPGTTEINEGSLPTGAVEGSNSSGQMGYTAPCPPSGTHRYFFRIYALDIKLNLPTRASRDQLDLAMNGHITSQGELMGKYTR